MKFGKYLEANREEEWADYYINYSQLKKLIDGIQSNAPKAEARFCQCLEENWFKYKKFYDEWGRNFLQERVTKASVIPIVQMNAFLYINQECLRKIIKKHDKNSDMKLAPSWNWKIQDKPFLQLIQVIAEVSKLYENTRLPLSPGTPLGTRSKRAHKHQVFWVPQERIMPLVCLIIQHLPMKTFIGKNGMEKLSEKMRTIYLDNKDMSVYSDVVSRPNDAETLQLQYTETDQDTVFVVRKHGREGFHSDICTQSGQMLLPLSQQAAASDNDKIYGRRCFLPANSVQEFLTHSNVPPAAEIGEDNMKSAKASALIIRDMKLIPLISTQCQIVQFEIAGVDSFRCALEMDIGMVRESPDSSANESSSRDAKHGKHQWVTDTEDVKDRDLYKFPHAILNVYSQGTYAEVLPDWFEKVTSQSDLVQPIDNFSKYAHGAYTFFSKHIGGGTNSNLTPHWISTHEDLFNHDIEMYSSGSVAHIPNLGVNNGSSLVTGDAHHQDQDGDGDDEEENDDDSDFDDVFDPDNDVKVHRMARDNINGIHAVSLSPGAKPISGASPDAQRRGSIEGHQRRGSSIERNINKNKISSPTDGCRKNRSTTQGSIGLICTSCGFDCCIPNRHTLGDKNIRYLATPSATSDDGRSSSGDIRLVSIPSSSSDLPQDQVVAHYQNELLLVGWITVSLLATITGVLILLWGPDSVTTSSISYWDVGALFIILAIIIVLRSIFVYSIRGNGITNSIIYEQRTSYSLLIISAGLIVAFIYPLVAYRK